MTRMLQGHKGVIEHVIPHLPTQGNALDFIEGPMNSEVDPTLTVFLLSGGERRETARNERAHVAVTAFSDPVQFVRHEGEWDIVGPVKAAQGLEQRTGHTRMA